MFRHWKLSAVLILVVFNCTLVLTFRDTRARIAQTFKSLAQSPVAPYFADQLEGRSLARALDYRVDQVQASAMGKASDSLRNAVMTIRHKYSEENNNLGSLGAVDYFSEKIAVDPNLQKDLVNAFEYYERELTNILQTEVARKRSKRDSVARVMRRDLEKLEAQGMRLPPGREISGTLSVVLNSSVLSFTLHGVHSGDSIRWEKSNNASLGYDDFVNLASQFQQTAHSPRLQFVANGLNKLSSVLADPGKCELYGKVYSLSAVTPGELDSITKQMLLLQWRLNRDLVDLMDELTSIKTQ